MQFFTAQHIATSIQSFLKIDFPRIPFTEDKKVFKQIAELGSELINVQLFQDSEVDDSFGEFLGKGNRTSCAIRSAA